MLRYNLRYQTFLVISDALIVGLMLFVAEQIRITVDLGKSSSPYNFETPFLLYPITIAMWIVMFQQAKVYSAVDSLHFRPAARSAIAGHSVACMVFLGVLFLTYRDYSRLQALYFMALTLAGVLTHRFALRLLREQLSPYMHNQRIVVIVGANPIGERLGAEIDNSDPGIICLEGFVLLPGEDPRSELSNSAIDGRILGEIDELPELVRKHGVEEVIIATRWFDSTTSDLITRIMLLLEDLPVSVRLAPDFSDLAYFQATSEYFHDMILVGLREPILTPAQRVLKRLFDIIFAGSILLVTWPLFLVIALAIRSEGPGPIIFRQKRIGQHGKRFTMYKFRTMVDGAEQIEVLNNGTQGVKQPEDPRVTRIGRFLRRTSLDELPQFFNVLRGDMSVVGPRPEMPWLVDRYEWWQRKRFEVPQGITGWWQITGRADKPMHLNTEDDLYYVRNYSFWLDLQIIFRTVISVITGRGAY